MAKKKQREGNILTIEELYLFSFVLPVFFQTETFGPQRSLNFPAVILKGVLLILLFSLYGDENVFDNSLIQ